MVAARTREHQFPDLNLAKRAYTHNLNELLEVSGLRSAMDQEFAQDPNLQENWETVKRWSETSRYEAGRHKDEAGALLFAITDPAHGVLSCISRYW